jgi:hypothetical protein
VCAQVGTVYACARLGAPASGITVRSTTQPAELWDAGDPDKSFGNLYYAFLAQTPVVLSFDVVTSFDNPDEDGFVEYDPATAGYCPTKDDGSCLMRSDCQCSRGSHAALAVGYVKNENLPEHAPKGLGGGWVVLKNSWGCSGDGGYYYLPVNWVKRYVTSARALGDVETSAPLPDQPVDDWRFDFKPVPPSIRITQPTDTERYVSGQQIPLVIEGADFEYEGYALAGFTHWTSDLQGPIGTGSTTHATLSQGLHQITATYVGKSGATATATTMVFVGPRPSNLPPAAYFENMTTGYAGCPASCTETSGMCVFGQGHGEDAEDGRLYGDASVRWYAQAPMSERQLSATGGSSQLKYVACVPRCIVRGDGAGGDAYTITLEVQDSAGQRAMTRRQVWLPGCVR